MVLVLMPLKLNYFFLYNDAAGLVMRFSGFRDKSRTNAMKVEGWGGRFENQKSKEK